MKEPIPRRDLRAEIKQAIERDGVSARSVAMKIEAPYNSFMLYLKGDRPLPEIYLERVLALLNL